ncbi:heparan-alpha-glucosaminide N-acetyltransferase [Entomortierella parvispora]|uniref:Heparan-alpha-glucosaminide N-acetyltransferase n=1 Tax=Entomortierella parvispora TaxID=205924 RepID=A0A9P3HG75_9FUNG|nr:heparan-alpha-glucosaminide N-acetyltransferase [Entomortierella parvispora]
MDPASQKEDSPVVHERQQPQHQTDDLTIIRSHAQNEESNFPSKDDSLATPDALATLPVRTRLSNRLKLSSNRLLSLDLLRGLAILLMITCNAQAGDRAFFILEHPDWIGFTIADTIFPSFLFISGVALPLAIRVPTPLEPGYNPKTIHSVYKSHIFKILKRSLIIMALGYILNLYGLVQLHVGADQFRWPGVLQRIGFCYLVVAYMHLLVLYRGVPPVRPTSFSYLFRSPSPSSHNSAATHGDVKKPIGEGLKDGAVAQEDDHQWPWLLRVSLPFWLPISCLLVWLICTYSVQVEGCPERGMVRVAECSAQAYFDLKIFGTAHTYRHLNFDPEGSLSSLTSILNVWFGWYIGCTVRTLNAQVKQLTSDFKEHRAASTNEGEEELLKDEILEQEMLTRIYMSHLGQWFWWGVLWMFTGWVFSMGLPLSKPSWTATYAVLAAGVSQTVLSILFYKFDAMPKIKHLDQLHAEHQAFIHQGQRSRHYVPRSPQGSLEQPSVGAHTRDRKYSRILGLYYKFDHLMRHLFRRSIIVVLGSMGRNAILMYMCSELVQGTCSLIPGGTDSSGESTDLCSAAFDHTWGALEIGGWSSLFYSLGFSAIHVLIAIWLDYKQWYFKV